PAMAPTVRGWSPETTLTWTPSAANQAMVSAASPRTRSPITTMARGSRAAGGPPACRASAPATTAPPPPDGEPVGLAEQGAVAVPAPRPVRGQQNLRGAEQEGAVAGEAGPAP